MPDPKHVAALVTEYRRHSHADVIVGKILEGFHHDGQAYPNLRLASLYVDQTPGTDMSRTLAQKYKFPIAKTIEAALTLGRQGIHVPRADAGGGVRTVFGPSRHPGVVRVEGEALGPALVGDELQ